MVQRVLGTGTPRGPSFSQRLNEGIGGAAQAVGKFYEQKQQQEQQQQSMKDENEAAKRYGIDISGIRDPKMRQEAFSTALERLKGEKPLNPLQEAQRKLAEQRASQIESQENMFNSLSGNNQQPNTEEGSQDRKTVSDWEEKDLDVVAGFAGQPGQRGVMGNIAKGEQDRRRLQRKEDVQFHKESAPYWKKITEGGDASKKRLRSFETMEKNLSSGKLNPKNFSNFMANLSKGSIFEGLFSNPETEEFKAASFNIYEGMKDTFGTRLSDADLKLASNKVPDPSKSEAANKKIIDFWKFFDKANIEKEKIGREIIRENKGLRPIDLEDQIHQRMDEKFGDEAQKKIYEVLKAPGLPLTEDLMDKYLDMAGDDPIEAERLAREDGYES